MAAMRYENRWKKLIIMGIAAMESGDLRSARHANRTVLAITELQAQHGLQTELSQIGIVTQPLH